MPDAVRENCPQAERQFRNAGMEGSFGAVQPKRHSCNRLMKVSCNVNSALKENECCQEVYTDRNV